jgi:CHAT domain-containing protein
LKMLREGAHRGVELPDNNPSSSNPTHDRRMPPFYWAAFELSGDWR